MRVPPGAELSSFSAEMDTQTTLEVNLDSGLSLWWMDHDDDR